MRSKNGWVLLIMLLSGIVLGLSLIHISTRRWL